MAIPTLWSFPRDDEMTVVCQGPFGGSEATAQGDQNWRGVKRILTTPSYASAHYTKEYDPELAATALKPFAQATIGYVGTYQMSYALLDYVKRAFPQARFVDATDMVDQIKVIKSAGRDGSGEARGVDAGRRDARRVRSGEAWHARH